MALIILVNYLFAGFYDLKEECGTACQMNMDMQSQRNFCMNEMVQDSCCDEMEQVENQLQLKGQTCTCDHSIEMNVQQVNLNKEISNKQFSSVFEYAEVKSIKDYNSRNAFEKASRSKIQSNDKYKSTEVYLI